MGQVGDDNLFSRFRSSRRTRYYCPLSAITASVVKLGHHGSKTASAKDYLSQIVLKLGAQLERIIIMVIQPETLQTLKQLKIQSVSTIDEE